MTGLNGQRVYLDWNASAPLRPEAREAMLAAMDVVGNPSSVHAEGRAARAIVERARGQVARLFWADPSEIIFTSGATEAAALVLSPANAVLATPAEHDACLAWATLTAEIDSDGQYVLSSFDKHLAPYDREWDGVVCVTLVNGETGIEIQNGPPTDDLNVLTDATQRVGRSEIVPEWGKYICSSHKLGGPSGVGALFCRDDRWPITPQILGGGQEKGRRSGTENVIGIAGFGAAAEAARRDLDAGVWDRVENLRNSLEERLASVAPDAIFFGREAPRLPNTSCFAVPGWAGETQVMQMDLAGFAVSAGSACSSGKVKKASRVLLAMGFDEETASSAIRVSMGPTTTGAEVMAFADAWIEAYRRRASRAA